MLRIHASHACAQATPGNLQKQWKFMCFVHVPQKGGPDQYNQNLTNRPKHFKNIVKMNNSTVWPCATSSPARSGSWRPRWIPRGAPSKNIGFPCVSEGAPLEFHWRHQCSECRPDQYHQNLTNRPKPFKNLVKMNNSTAWFPPAATQRRSGSRHARSERELRAKCVTWKTLKNHRKSLCFCMPPQRVDLTLIVKT